MKKDCKHEYERAIENIKIDNDGLKGFKGISGFKYSRAYFIVLKCIKCSKKNYQRLVVE